MSEQKPAPFDGIRLREWRARTDRGATLSHDHGLELLAEVERLRAALDVQRLGALELMDRAIWPHATLLARQIIRSMLAVADEGIAPQPGPAKYPAGATAAAVKSDLDAVFYSATLGEGG